MIKLSNLSKYYHSGNSVALGLRKINLEFERGEFVAITGESGSGKTTLLSTISGLLPYEDGELFFLGEPTSHYEEADWEAYRKNHIAFVFQNYNLIDSYTALENVMTSLLIQGVEKKEAKETALSLLTRVGIASYASHRALELSSGQKQRLSIARALAKNTEVIVADEPTGNLDAENGAQIMQLFSELAKEKLVLIVTHNFEEAAPYVTRKIRIYDGEVAEDISLRPPYQTEEPLKTKQAAPLSCTDGKKAASLANGRRIARLFARMDMKARPRRSLLLTFFLFLTAAASFLFFGNFLANLDDTATKQYTNEAFYNSDKTRIIVRHPDNAAITEEDLAFFSSLPYVKETDLYGIINDMNYFFRKDRDYSLRYYQMNYGEDSGEMPKFEVSPLFKDFSRFARSATALSAEDLVCGSLPESTNEVVLYTEDTSLLGSTFTCYFSNRKDLASSSYFSLELTICGILREETDQCYFSENVAKALMLTALEVQQSYFYNGLKRYVNTHFYTDSNLSLLVSEEEASEAATAPAFAAAVSPSLFSELIKRETPLMVFITDDISDDTSMFASANIDQTLPEHLLLKKRLSAIENNRLLEWNVCSDDFILLSEPVFLTLTADIASPQAGVFITDYAYMDETLAALYKAGYEAVCPFRIGSVSYDTDKVTERLITLSLSLAALFVLFFLEIILVRALLKTGIHDALILKSIGMEQAVLEQINWYSLLCYLLAAFTGMLVFAALSGNFLSQVHALFVYYRPYHIGILFLLNLSAALLTGMFYNRYLRRLLFAGRGGF